MRDLKILAEKLALLRSNATAAWAPKLDNLADADLFHKGIVWALRYETNLTAKDVTLLKQSLERGHQRANALLANRTPWTARKGKVLRGYISVVDGSTQPFSVIVPASYDGAKPMRLDVVLHGSTLHTLDSVDYAANAGVVPAIAAIGDQDVFFQAHVIMGDAMAREGLRMVNLISHGTGHVIDPATHREQMRRIGEFADRGRDHAPRQLRFVTWTLKYNRCHWLELLALKTHHERAEIAATVAEDGSLDIAEPRNITQFAIHPPMLQTPGAKLRVGGAEIALPDRGHGGAGRAIVLAQRGGKWKFAGTRDAVSPTGKRRGVQGPIDDAFTAPFLCVRGTGRPWNGAVGAWADASLRRFAHEWARYMRGDLPVKNDTEVTAGDIRTKNLILFGDPGSNRWIRKALPRLPLAWSRNEVRIGPERRPSKDHSPVLICANPLSGAGDHYLVLNSGHTFHEKEFAAFNYLLFPRLGDWAIIRVLPGAENWPKSSESFPEEVIRAGFFDESWKKPLALPADHAE